ncbi:MAG: carbon-nitrogen family hydrolase [Elusimicrobiota bacterium]
MKIGLFQYDIKWEDKNLNKEKILNIIESSPYKNNIDWLIFSEMTLSGFTMNREIATLSDSDKSFFSDISRKYNMYVSFGGVEEGCNKLITLNRKGERISEYSKIHLYAYGKEDRYYKKGEKREIFEIDGLKVMPAICFDLRFPYLFWNVAEKVDVYVVIAAWPMKRSEHWKTLLKARAIENQAYCFGVNRIGFENKIEYSGNSMGFDPMGNVLIDAKNAEGIFVNEEDIRKEVVVEVREKFPFLKERLKFSF